MVSYFVPRGRILVKAGNIRQAQKHFMQQQEKKWPMLHNFYQSFATTSTPISRATTTITSNNLFKRSASTAKKNFAQIKNTTTNTQQQQYKQCKPDTFNAEYDKGQRKSWKHWTGFLLRWAPVGIFMFSAMEWQWHKNKCIKNELPRRASEFQMKVYCSLPLRIISRCWGWLASCYVPTLLRPLIYGSYARAFNVNMEEALYADYKHYNSLSEFFTRSLREGVRPIDEMATLVSPADGKVLHFGTVSENSLIEQVKGVNYSLEDFLGPATWQYNEKSGEESKEFVNAIKKHNDKTQLYQCVIYLAPGDYHRFHSSATWSPKLRRHFSGELLSVNPRVASWMPGLFCLNERVLYMGDWEHGFFSYTAVGATNVGSVEIFMDEQLKTNCWLGLNIGTHKKKHKNYDEVFMTIEQKLQKGELLGQFNMGSTIVLIFEAPKNFVFDIEAGQKVLVGQGLGHLG